MQHGLVRHFMNGLDRHCAWIGQTLYSWIIHTASMRQVPTFDQQGRVALGENFPSRIPRKKDNLSTPTWVVCDWPVTFAVKQYLSLGSWKRIGCLWWVCDYSSLAISECDFQSSNIWVWLFQSNNIWVWVVGSRLDVDPVQWMDHVIVTSPFGEVWRIG